MREGERLLLAAMIILACLPQHGIPGIVRDLTFEPGRDGAALIIRWRPPAGIGSDVDLEYEIEDRGLGPWRPVHRGPETRLRVLELRSGPCTLRVRALSATGAGPWSQTDCQIDLDRRPQTAPPPGCRETPGTACLLGDRFAAYVYRLVDGNAVAARVEPADRRPDRAFRLESESGSVRVELRILDLCARNGHYGLQYRVHGNLAFRIRVRDLLAEQERSFLAPAGRNRPPQVAYNEVFATCR